MRNLQQKINNDMKFRKNNKSFNENILPKVNCTNKLLSLPIINNNHYDSERRPSNNNKKQLEGFKPIEDKKIRNKFELKDSNNVSNIKYISFDKTHRKYNLLSLLKKIKYTDNKINLKKIIINDDLFKNDSFINKDLVLLNHHYNNTLKESKKVKTNLKKICGFSKLPKKIKAIEINEPNLNHNTININSNSVNIQNIIHEYKYNPLIKKNKERNGDDNKNKLLIHNIFFKWNNNNIFHNEYLDMIKSENVELNHSFYLSSNSMIRKEKVKKLKNMNNNTIKSAGLSRYYHNKIKKKFDLEINNDIINKNQKINYLINKINVINQENIDIKYLNTNSFNDLFDSLSRNNNLNNNITIKRNKIDNNILENLINSDKIKINKNIFLKMKDNYNIKFFLKFLRKNRQNKDKHVSNTKYNKDIDESSSGKDFSNNHKKKEKINKEINNNEVQKINKSLNLNQKINLSNMHEKNDLKENQKSNQNENFKEKFTVFDYKNEKTVNNINSSTKGKTIVSYKEKFSKDNKHTNSILTSNNKKETIEKKLIDETTNNKDEIKDIKKEMEKTINNLNNKLFSSIKTEQKHINKNYDQNMMNNTSSKFNENENNLNSRTQKNNIISIDFINDDIVIQNDVSNITNIDEKSNIFFQENTNSIIGNITNNKGIINKSLNKSINYNNKNITNTKNNNNNKYKDNNKYISDINVFVPSIKYEKEKTKNGIKNKNKNGKLYNRNENLKSKTFKTDNDINISENKNKDIYELTKTEDVLENIKKLDISNNKENKIVLEESNNINNSSEIEKRNTFSPNKTQTKEKKYIKEENNKPKESYRRNSISVTAIQKRRNELQFKCKKRLSYISTYKTSKKNNTNTYNIKEDKSISSQSETDKTLSEEKGKNESFTKDNILVKNSLATNQEKEDIKKEVKLDDENIITKTPAESEEESDIDLIKVSMKKTENNNNLKSLIESLNHIEEEIKKNDILNVSYNNNLNEEETKNLLLYSAQLRKISELNALSKTDEIIHMEKEIKQKYNEILGEFIIKEKYRDLIKNKGRTNKNKKFKILYEEIIENEKEITWVLKIKKEKVIQKSKRRKTKIGYEFKEKNKKELIYDNSYLFNKDKKKKEVIIKKEVLDILQTEYSPEKIKKKMDDYIVSIKTRKSIFEPTRRMKRLKKVKKYIKPIDKHKLSLFTDIVEEKKEKIETEDDKKEKLFDDKMNLFNSEIEKLKKSERDFDYFDFLKHKDISRNDNMVRLIGFTEKISRLRNSGKSYNSKFNFFSPIEFKMINYNK